MFHVKHFFFHEISQICAIIILLFNNCEGKSMNDIRIRIAKKSDAKDILDIYIPYIIKTAITFECEVPSIKEFENRISHTLEKFPYLVAERNSEILGYAYASSFNERAAYAWNVETSIYIKENQRNSGIGRNLYNALENILSLQNILNLNACIAYPEVEDEYLTKNSVRFHEHLGYSYVGEFHKCGYKFGRWYNMVWMEKHIGSHPNNPAETKTFDSIKTLVAEQYNIL